MGKLTVLINTTLDGYVDAENIIIDPELFEFTEALMSEAEVALFGRNTFEMFQARWPQRLIDESSPDWIKSMAQSLHNIQKVVFSSSLKTTTWHNSKIESEIDFIRSFKENSKGGLLTFGSLSIVETLMELNLVDDYYFNIQPLIPGKGEARFYNKKQLSTPRLLKYVDCKVMASGAHLVHYQNADIT